ncbi:hypothetical protein [Terricaulis sp.]|uniref:hypothetical protein n=1 Tax=Terricaulis sp. TaxID=2768686 RepID=UPI002ADE3B47|nr:hypothetical protein [Terricaulis sp.]
MRPHRDADDEKAHYGAELRLSHRGDDDAGGAQEEQRLDQHLVPAVGDVHQSNTPGARRRNVTVRTLFRKCEKPV